MSERIYLTYTVAAGIGSAGIEFAEHAVVNYVNASGQHFILEGKPKNKFDTTAGKLGALALEEMLSPDSQRSDSLFGNLEVVELR